MSEDDLHRLKIYPLRMEPELRAELERAAQAQNQSLNALINNALQQYISKSDTVLNSIEKRLSSIESQLRSIAK